MYTDSNDRLLQQSADSNLTTWHPNTMNYLTSRQMDYVLQMKRQEFDQTIKSIRYVCDDVIRESVCRGKLPVEFTIPKKLVNKEFNSRVIVVELVRSLEADGFYTQLSPKGETTLHIYPKNVASCNFLNMSESARTFVQQIKSVEQDKTSKYQQPSSTTNILPSSSSSSSDTSSLYQKQQQKSTTVRNDTPSYSTKASTPTKSSNNGNTTSIRLVGIGDPLDRFSTGSSYAPPSPRTLSGVL